MGRVITAVSSGGGDFAAVCIFVLALLVTCDVALRYLFRAPIPHGTEVSAFILVAIAFMGAAFTLNKERHINVNIVVNLLPQRMQSYVGVITSIVMLIFIGILSWAVYDLVWFNYTSHARTLGGLPKYIPQIILPIGVTLLFLQVLVKIFRDIRSLVKIRQSATDPGE